MPTAKEKRLIRLLEAGYFPAELPTPFVTKSFSAESPKYGASWDAAKIRRFWTQPELHTIPRYGEARRRVSIVNPINQLYVSKLIADNWADIKSRLSRSKTSEFEPKIIPAGNFRAVQGVDFDGVERKRIRLLAKYGRYVRTDVTRFYPSIYTHSIAWALVGKSYAKLNHNSQQFRAHYANYLDKAVSAGQQGQTIGIPVGPDTSRIIAELVATEVETIVRSQISEFNSRTVRYVDDFLLGLKPDETPELVLSKLSAALYEYELELSPDKTSLHGLGEPHAPDWVHSLRVFNISTKPTTQLTDLSSYFDQVFHLSAAHSRSNVIYYAVRRATAFAVHNDNWDEFVRWLLYCCRRSPTCISFVAEYLTNQHKTGRRIKKSEVRKFIIDLLPRLADAGHTNEIAWLLFWMRELGYTLPVNIADRIVALKSSVCALLIADLMQSGCIPSTVDFNPLILHANADGLKSGHWLAVYELTKKGWWPTHVSSTFVSSHNFFGDLWADDVSFYDPAVQMPAPMQSSPFSTLSQISFLTDHGYD